MSSIYKINIINNLVRLVSVVIIKLLGAQVIFLFRMRNEDKMDDPGQDDLLIFRRNSACYFATDQLYFPLKIYTSF